MPGSGAGASVDPTRVPCGAVRWGPMRGGRERTPSMLMAGVRLSVFFYFPCASVRLHTSQSIKPISQPRQGVRKGVAKCGIARASPPAERGGAKGEGGPLTAALAVG